MWAIIFLRKLKNIVKIEEQEIEEKAKVFLIARL